VPLRRRLPDADISPVAAPRVTSTRPGDGASEESTVTTLFQALYTLSFTAVDRVQALKDEEKGASAVEYALLVGVLAVIVVGVIYGFGEKLKTLFSGITLSTAKPAGS
jgi:pilus assembly protein Flp/PilA